ncbi:MAG: GHMP kinase [Firmicutes bacterium]|nr:GHMP kinase [Bacillota bacterium]
MIIRSRAPLRISFAGGGTDIPPYSEEKGGAVLSTAIDKYAYCTLIPRLDSEIIINLIGHDVIVNQQYSEEAISNGEFDLARSVVKNFAEKGGMNLYIQTDVPLGSGLGCSSSIVVALIGAFMYWLGKRLTDYEVAELAYHIEREQLGIKGGKQDHYAATFGGFNFIEFSREKTVVNPLRIPDHILDELRYHLLLCYVGSRPFLTNIIQNQVDNYVHGKEDVVCALASLRMLTILMKDALLRGRLKDFGELLSDAWESKKRLADGISNDHIDQLYNAARQNGAIGGKILGAGGGGYLLLYCPFDRKHLVAKVVRSLGGQIVHFGFEPGGLRTWETGEDVPTFRPGEVSSDMGGD